MWNLRIPGSGTCLDVPRSFGDRNSDFCIALGNLKEESGLSDIKYKNLKHDIFNNKYLMKKWRICVLAHLAHIRPNSNSVQNGGLS